MSRRRELVAVAMGGALAIGVACGNNLGEDVTVPPTDGGTDATSDAASGPSRLAWVKRLDIDGDGSVVGAGSINSIAPAQSGAFLSGYVAGTTGVPGGATIAGAFRATAAASDGALSSIESHVGGGAYAFGQGISSHATVPEPFWAIQFDGPLDLGDAGFGGDGGADYNGLVVWRPGGSFQYRYFYGGDVQITQLVARPSGNGVIVSGLAGTPTRMLDQQATDSPVTGATARTIFVARVMTGNPDLVVASATNGIRHVDQAIASDTVSTVYLGGAFSDLPPFAPNASKAEGDADAFVTAFDDDLNVKWLVTFGGAGTQEVTALAASQSMGVFAAGSFNGECTGRSVPTLTSRGNDDAFVARLGADGSVVWLRSFGAGGDEKAQSIAVDPARKRLYVSFFTTSPDLDLVGGMASPDQTYGVLAELDEDGNVLEVLARGAPASKYDQYPLAVDTTGALFFGGGLPGSVVIGTETIAKSTQGALFYARINP